MKKIMLIGMILLCLAGCKPQGGSVPSSAPESPTIITKAENTHKYEEMAVYEECEYEFSDGEKAQISLMTDASVYEDGEFMLDDGHNWVLTAEINGGTYVLYEEYIRAVPSLMVSEYYTDEDNTKLGIRLEISTSASYEIREFKLEEEGFSQKVAYSSGAINELTVTKNHK